MTESQFRAMLQEEVDNADSLRAYAKEIGISPGYLSLLLNGTKPISDAVAQVFGYREVAQERKYEKIPKK